MLLRTKTNRYLARTLLFVALVFCHAPHTFAEQAESSLFELSLAELVNIKLSVASVFEASELDVASSVSLLKHEDWENRGARRVGDALESVPSVLAMPTWGGAEAIAIRGYATELSVRSVTNMLDGVPLNTLTFGTSFYDKPIISLGLLDRIEVIRGPGSTLYGSDAFHGVLAYQTRNFDKDHDEVRVDTGAPSYTATRWLSSSSLGEGRLHSGIATQHQGRQGIEYAYTNPYSSEREAGTREHSFSDVSAFLTYETGDLLNGYWRLNTYTSHYESADQAGIGTQFFVGFADTANLSSASVVRDLDHSDQDSDFWLGQVDYARQLSDSLEVSAQVYHWESKQEWRFDNRRYLETFGPFSCLTEPDPAAVYPFYCPHELSQGSKERRSGFESHFNQAFDTFDTKFVYGLGIDQLKIKQSYFRRISPDNDVYVDGTSSHEGKKRTIRFAFLQGSTEFLDQKWQLVYGMRIDDYSDISSHRSPRLGLIYRVNPDWVSKWLYGHAFRAPTAIESEGGVDGAVPNPHIKPSEIDTYEWINIFSHHNGQTQLTAFSSHWDDAIILTPTGSGNDNQYVNTGKNAAYGLELSTRHQIERWTLQSASSYVRSRNKDSDLEYGAFPKWLLTFDLQYQLPDLPLLLTLHERIMASYRQSDTLGMDISDKSGNYYRTDIGLRYRLPGKSSSQNHLYLTVRNLWNKDNTLPSVYNAEGGIPDFARQITAGLQLNF